jgi:predicted nucleic acid-binding protein
VILVDSSVWIDHFRGSSTPQTTKLAQILRSIPVLVGDLVLAEVLQGFRSNHEFNQALRLMTSLHVIELGGEQNAIKAAQNYRILRQRGITVRKTIDAIIATHCIESGYRLLYCDHDFDPFVAHFGLRSAMP